MVKRFEGLEKEIAYIGYMKRKEIIYQMLQNDYFDEDYIKALVSILSDTRKDLDLLKKKKEEDELWLQ